MVRFIHAHCCSDEVATCGPLKPKLSKADHRSKFGLDDLGTNPKVAHPCIDLLGKMLKKDITERCSTDEVWKPSLI